MPLYIQTNIPAGFDNSGRVFEFPSDHYAIERSGGDRSSDWVYIETNEKKKVASIKSDAVLAIYKVEDKQETQDVPVDTRLNYLTLKRDSRGRFVSHRG